MEESRRVRLSPRCRLRDRMRLSSSESWLTRTESPAHIYSGHSLAGRKAVDGDSVIALTGLQLCCWEIRVIR